MCWKNLKSSRIYSTAAHTESIRWSVIVKMASFQSHPNCVHLRCSQTMSFHQAWSRLLHSRRRWGHSGHSETVACFSRLFSKGILRYIIRFFLCVFLLPVILAREAFLWKLSAVKHQVLGNGWGTGPQYRQMDLNQVYCLVWKELVYRKS